VIVIVDYKMGNLGSICNMLKKIGAESVITSDADEIRRASKLILPGVGAFDVAMTHINELGLLEVLNEKVLRDKTPVLGICLGIQLLTRHSEEGKLPGLGWIDGRTIRFRFDKDTKLKIPHMGWNEVQPRSKDCLFKDMDGEAGFYFVHSYHVECDTDEEVLATAHHGYEFVCAVRKGNIVGTQFHPEKSHRYGMQVLKNYVELF